MEMLLIVPTAFEGPRQVLHLTSATKDLMDWTAQAPQAGWTTKHIKSNMATKSKTFLPCLSKHIMMALRKHIRMALRMAPSSGTMRGSSSTEL